MEQFTAILFTFGFVIGVITGAVLYGVVESFIDVSDINVGDIQENKRKSL